MTLVMKLTNNDKLIAASSFVVTAFGGGGEEWPVLYNIRGGRLAQLLYNVTWGRGVEKNGIFCYIICGRPPIRLRF